MSAVGILHPGAMGAAVGAALSESGRDVIWASEGRSEATRRRAAALRDVGTVDALLGQAEVVLSICPPGAALDVARQVAGYDGTYVDANAIAPATSQKVAKLIGPNYVDGGIIGPPPHEPGTTRLYLGGDSAPALVALFAGTAVDARSVADASALKMVYAAWTKGSAALMLATWRTATELGVADDLGAEWDMSQPAARERLAAAEAAATEKGWRWSAEMEEIARTFAAAGQPAGFHEAATEVYTGFGKPSADAS
jgi:ketol-acid reductoisomerase